MHTSINRGFVIIVIVSRFERWTKLDTFENLTPRGLAAMVSALGQDLAETLAGADRETAVPCP